MYRHRREQVVVITGASAGVGRATARAFAARGARVALLARGRGGLEAAAGEVRAAGGQALVMSVDVTDHQALDQAADMVEDTWGPIDVWINNAATAIFAPVPLVGADSFRRVTEVTYLGYVFGTQCALRKMLPRDAGTIVQVGSALAYRGIPLQAAYCAAKHAILGFHESLRCELLPTGSKVAVTMVQLPSVNTPLYDWMPAEAGRQPRPVPPAYHPDVAARGILHAADHPRRREYWVGGQSLVTILATKAAPAIVDRVLVAAGYWLASSSKPHPAPPSNLWAAADDDQERGVEGHCVSYTRRFSMQLWASHHRVPVAAIGALAAWALVRRLASAQARSLKARACQRLALRER